MGEGGHTDRTDTADSLPTNRHERRPRCQQHARYHRLLATQTARSREDFVLNLIFRKPYEHVATLDIDGPILDLGCNTGYDTAIMRVLTDLTIVGADVSKSAVRYATATYGGNFQVIDGRTLPFDNGVFGAVVSFQVIEHIPDTRTYLSEIRRVLKPGGHALFTTPNAAQRLEPGEKPWYRFHVREYTGDELRDVVAPLYSGSDIERSLDLMAHTRVSAPILEP